MQHTQKTIERFKYIKPGCNIADIIENLPKELQISKFYSRGGNMRLDFDSLAPTLVPSYSAFDFTLNLIEVLQLEKQRQ